MASENTNNLVGIDLGADVSVIARLDADGSVTTLLNQEGGIATPSAVYIDGSKAVVGRVAKDAAQFDPDGAALHFLRDIGSPAYSRPLAGRRFRPETLAAIVLRKLKQDVEKRIGPISRAVITVPAFFDDTRRKAIEDAGRIAGLEVLDILNRSTAAAIAYAAQPRLRPGDRGPLLDIPGGRMTALVYDLGRDGFDVTVVRSESKRFETLATDGKVLLGSKDWDDKIALYVAHQFLEKYGTDPAADEHGNARLAALAERTRGLLDGLSDASIEFSYQGQSLALSLSRETFEEMCIDLLRRTQVVTDLVVTREAGLRWEDMDRVLLVGGATKMPMIGRMLEELSGKPPDRTIDPQQAVAHGAAIHAGITVAQAGESETGLEDHLWVQLQDVMELNVNAHSLGIEVIKSGRRTNAVLIPKNTQLPFAASKIFRLRHAGETFVRFKVLEGEAPDASLNVPIGELRISGLPPDLPKGAPIQVRLAYGANGRVSVMALDMTHGRFAESTIERATGLTQEDVCREAEYVASLDIG